MSSRNEFFSNLVNEWYDPLYRFAYSLRHNPDDFGTALSTDACRALRKE